MSHCLPLPIIFPNFHSSIHFKGADLQYQIQPNDIGGLFFEVSSHVYLILNRLYNPLPTYDMAVTYSQVAALMTGENADSALLTS